MQEPDPPRKSLGLPDLMGRREDGLVPSIAPIPQQAKQGVGLKRI
jgi:hypothetical protein